MKTLLESLESETDTINKLQILEEILSSEKIDRVRFLRDQYNSEGNFSKIQIILTLREHDSDFSRRFLEEILLLEKETFKKVQILEALGEIGNCLSIAPIYEATKNDFALDYEDMPLQRIGEEIIRVINRR
ncbi:hypothetical protein [Deinococcus aquaedulcis]|uniref:hypothetical protein n=1 Tax=Deinococcus aquaedulcis TaxID=2840455 RepID=UPI001C83E86D|nr:hypothetical protein [Deinococcus aquaedulcis]